MCVFTECRFLVVFLSRLHQLSALIYGFRDQRALHQARPVFSAHVGGLHFKPVRLRGAEGRERYRSEVNVIVMLRWTDWTELKMQLTRSGVLQTSFLLLSSGYIK